MWTLVAFKSACSKGYITKKNFSKKGAGPGSRKSITIYLLTYCLNLLVNFVADCTATGSMISSCHLIVYDGVHCSTQAQCSGFKVVLSVS